MTKNGTAVRRAVAVVEDFEREVRTFQRRLEIAREVACDLMESRYPGAGMLEDDLRECSAALHNLIEALEDMRIGGGDRAAFDWHFLVKRRGLTLSAAARDLFEGGPDYPSDGIDAVERIAGLRGYAATVAS